MQNQSPTDDERSRSLVSREVAAGAVRAIMRDWLTDSLRELADRTLKSTSTPDGTTMYQFLPSDPQANVFTTHSFSRYSDMMVSPYTKTFDQLPAELQLMIWEAALLRPRVRPRMLGIAFGHGMAVPHRRGIVFRFPPDFYPELWTLKQHQATRHDSLRIALACKQAYTGVYLKWFGRGEVSTENLGIDPPFEPVIFSLKDDIFGLDYMFMPETDGKRVHLARFPRELQVIAKARNVYIDYRYFTDFSTDLRKGKLEKPQLRNVYILRTSCNNMELKNFHERKGFLVTGRNSSVGHEFSWLLELWEGDVREQRLWLDVVAEEYGLGSFTDADLSTTWRDFTQWSRAVGNSIICTMVVATKLERKLGHEVQHWVSQGWAFTNEESKNGIEGGSSYP
ncbi:hypothetical protein GGR57DRAFT_502422 [Xylariaceae sp. FL1272]|nr:hypothetical protein GGR57DRAFT_502422 [Xylariaceae sp. FL1272]